MQSTIHQKASTRSLPHELSAVARTLYPALPPDEQSVVVLLYRSQRPEEGPGQEAKKRDAESNILESVGTMRRFEEMLQLAHNHGMRGLVQARRDPVHGTNE